jgi:hypothetical protein
MGQIDCVICLETLEEDSKVLACNHSFHSSCISEWENNKNECPICREPIHKIVVTDIETETNTELTPFRRHITPNLIILNSSFLIISFITNNYELYGPLFGVLGILLLNIKYTYLWLTIGSAILLFNIYNNLVNSFLYTNMYIGNIVIAITSTCQYFLLIVYKKIQSI